LRGKSGIDGLAASARAARTILGGAGVHQGIKTRAIAIGVLLLAAVACAASMAVAQSTSVTTGTILEPAVWQGPEINAQSVANKTSASGESMHSVTSPLRLALQPTPPVPPQDFRVSPSSPGMQGLPSQTMVPPSNPTVTTPTQPLLDGNSPAEDLMPPVVDGCGENGGRHGVQPYGGGHPDDWSWGCGGSPYRTGPGLCDNYKVGPRWHWTFDGLVMSRDETNLNALADQMFANDPTGIAGAPQTENFGYGPGGRLTITSQVPRWVGYQLQAAYEGIIDWDAAIVYPKTTPVAGAGATSTQQRSLHYTSTYNSGEISWVRSCDDNWHPFCGVRFIKLDERLNDFLNQETPPPLPGAPPQGPFTVQDRRNLFNIENKLMGFQVGMLRESWCINERFTIEGFANAGVYYNKISYFNKMGTYTTQQIADDTTSPDENEARTDIANSTNVDKSDLSEIAYVTEASITGVCRLNKCWAMRAGYQVLWIDNVHLADAAFLGNTEQSDSLLFHGWHAGFECRR